MGYWKCQNIPQNDSTLKNIIFQYVVSCPSSIRKKEGGGYVYSSVSQKKNCSFRKRGITHSLLTTLLSQIKKSLVTNEAYHKLEPNDSVENKIEEIIKNTTLSDEHFDLVIFKKHSNMSDTEAIFYYIRNAFAHGSFGIKTINNNRIYYLESKRDTIKALMRLKESTLKKYIKLMKKSPAEIKKLQKNKKP